MERRKFIQKGGALLSLPAFTSATEFPSYKNNLNEINWKAVAKEYNHGKKYINLNTGSAGILSKTTLQFLNDCSLQMGQTSPYQCLDNWMPLINDIKQKLANLIGASTEEIALVRNTTEAINFILQGYPFKPKDEIIFANNDYPYVHNSIQQLAKTKNIQPKILNIDLQKATKESIIIDYQKALSPKTKLLVLTYITHREGIVFPIKEITEIAHQNGTEVLLDAAHAFAHIPHKVTNLNCDYYATSLHKWLSAPYGNGLLYIKKDKIAKIQPTISSYENENNSIKKLEHLGTRAFQNIVAIKPALDFLLEIGLENKLKRLKSLTKYWIKRLAEIKNAQLVSPINEFDFGGIASFKVEGQSSKKIVQSLLDDYGIIAKATGMPNSWSAVRISTNVFISEKQLDKMIEALKQITKQS